LTDAHALKNAPRLGQALAAQSRLAARLRALARHLHLLIPSLRAAALVPEEEALRVKLQEIESVLRSAALVGKMNELWAMTNALKNARDGPAAERTRWAVVDEEGLAQLVQVCVALSQRLILSHRSSDTWGTAGRAGSRHENFEQRSEGYSDYLR
jgi:nuclear pore complex protein Nup54